MEFLLFDTIARIHNNILSAAVAAATKFTAARINECSNGFFVLCIRDLVVEVCRLHAGQIGNIFTTVRLIAGHMTCARLYEIYIDESASAENVV